MTVPVRTTCPYCGVGCGVLAAPAADGAVQIAGDPTHPANFGKLCSKGAALAHTIDLDGRLLHPRVDGVRASWTEALDRVADGFAQAIRTHGPDSVAFYVSGQLLTEDYYVANKLMKGFIGSANIDTNSRLCMASSVAGHKRAFGADTVSGCYEDLDMAQLVVLVGSNAAWCHPVLYRRLEEARARPRPPKIVVIDPRRTDSCDLADLHLAIRPGSDVALFNGLLAHLDAAGCTDTAFVEAHTEGAGPALARAREDGAAAAVATACGIDVGDVEAFFALFAETEQVVTLYSQGVNQSSSGTDKVNAILNCHLLCGRIGRPGMGPFSLTGQPNAMGGREVGGMANQLAAHMELGDTAATARVGRFWGAPGVAAQAGLKAVDLFAAMGRGEIKAVWIMGTNPAVSMPDADAVRAALKGCDLVVVSDCMERTDTTAFADVILPALTWGEKDGTVTNSERRISRQRAFLPAPGEARADWWTICQVARRLGFGAGFAYDGAAAIFAEHAALSGFENDGARDFDISALQTMNAAQYDALQPVQWPVTRSAPQGTARLFGDGRFYTPSGRARFVALTPRPPKNAPDGDAPLIFNTGRVRDHWHTLTRTAKAARLSAHVVEPFVAVHPRDGENLGLEDGALATIASRWGTMTARVRVDDGQRPGEVFAPFHWTDQYASRGRAGALVNPVVDPVSGQPELKHTPVAVAPWHPAWHGFALTVAEPPPPAGEDYAVLAKAEGCWRQELAGDEAPADWQDWARARLGFEAGDDWLVYRDAGVGRHRFARMRDGRLLGCVFIAADLHLPARAWLEGLFVRPLDDFDRRGLLAGVAMRADADGGPIICSCFSVGLNRITAAIAEGELTTVEEIGEVLKAGTNCGSCRPELRKLLG